MKSLSACCPFRVFSGAHVERTSHRHVRIKEEHSAAVGNLDDDFRVSLDSFVNTRSIEEKIPCAKVSIPPAHTRFYHTVVTGKWTSRRTQTSSDLTKASRTIPPKHSVYVLPQNEAVREYTSLILLTRKTLSSRCSAD